VLLREFHEGGGEAVLCEPPESMAFRLKGPRLFDGARDVLSTQGVVKEARALAEVSRPNAKLRVIAERRAQSAAAQTSRRDRPRIDFFCAIAANGEAGVKALWSRLNEDKTATPNATTVSKTTPSERCATNLGPARGRLCRPYRQCLV